MLACSRASIAWTAKRFSQGAANGAIFASPTSKGCLGACSGHTRETVRVSDPKQQLASQHEKSVGRGGREENERRGHWPPLAVPPRPYPYANHEQRQCQGRLTRRCDTSYALLFAPAASGWCQARESSVCAKHPSTVIGAYGATGRNRAQQKARA